MAKKRRQQNRNRSVPANSNGNSNSNSNSRSPNLEDSNSTKKPTHKCRLCSHNVEELNSYSEEQLIELCRKKLYDIYSEALSRLINMGYAENEAIRGLTNGYWSGKSDCLTNIVESSSEFLSSKEVGSISLGNLENVVNFNLNFMAFILGKKMPDEMTRRTIFLCIFVSNMNFDIEDVDIDNAADDIEKMITAMTAMKLDDDDNDDDHDSNGDKDTFLPDETREMLSNWNILDKNADSISEDTKDKVIVDLNKMVDDLESQVYERVRWATKTVAKAITKLNDESVELVKMRKWRNENDPKMYLEELNLLSEKYSEGVLFHKEYELAQLVVQFTKTGKAVIDLKTEREKIKAEIYASMLINSETKEKCLEALKREKNLEKQRLKQQEEIAIEKKKILDAERQLVEIETGILEAESRLVEVTKEKEETMVRLAVETSLNEYKSKYKRNSSACGGWKCIICKEYKSVRIVFLPCAHQVMCVYCNGEHENKGNTLCPCCHQLIERRINPYG